MDLGGRGSVRASLVPMTSLRVMGTPRVTGFPAWRLAMLHRLEDSPMKQGWLGRSLALPTSSYPLKAADLMSAQTLRMALPTDDGG